MESRILVLDGNQRASLAAVRSLGSKGLWVAVAESSSPSMAGMSRHSRGCYSYPDPQISPRAFFESLQDLIAELGITFLLPITEVTTYAVLRYRQELPNSVTLPFPSDPSLEMLANKNKLFELASEQGVRIPDTIYCQNRSDAVAEIARIRKFPIILKPFKSKILTEERILSTHVAVAKDADQALKILRENAFFDFPFTIQSFVEGNGQGLFALFDKGQPICYFAHRRLREKPPEGGVSVLSESAPLDEQLKNAAEKLLRAAHWHGVAMVEFRVSHDGAGYLMEVNPRFWGSLQLAVDSGIDFPWWLYLMCTGQALPNMRWKRRRVRWVLGDLDRLFIILKAPYSAYSLRQKLLEIAVFFRPSFRTSHEVNRWSDVKPFWFELKQYIRALKN